MKINNTTRISSRPVSFSIHPAPVPRIGHIRKTFKSKKTILPCAVQIVGEIGSLFTGTYASQKAKICNNCGLSNHFDKECRKKKESKASEPKERSIITVDEEPHGEDSVSFLQ